MPFAFSNIAHFERSEFQWKMEKKIYEADYQEFLNYSSGVITIV